MSDRREKFQNMGRFLKERNLSLLAGAQLPSFGGSFKTKTGFGVNSSIDEEEAAKVLAAFKSKERKKKIKKFTTMKVKDFSEAPASKKRDTINFGKNMLKKLETKEKALYNPYVYINQERIRNEIKACDLGFNKMKKTLKSSSLPASKQRMKLKKNPLVRESAELVQKENDPLEDLVLQDEEEKQFEKQVDKMVKGVMDKKYSPSNCSKSRSPFIFDNSISVNLYKKYKKCLDSGEVPKKYLKSQEKAKNDKFTSPRDFVLHDPECPMFKTVDPKKATEKPKNQISEQFKYRVFKIGKVEQEDAKTLGFSPEKMTRIREEKNLARKRVSTYLTKIPTPDSKRHSVFFVTGTDSVHNMSKDSLDIDQRKTTYQSTFAKHNKSKTANQTRNTSILVFPNRLKKETKFPKYNPPKNFVKKKKSNSELPQINLYELTSSESETEEAPKICNKFCNQSLNKRYIVMLRTKERKEFEEFRKKNKKLLSKLPVQMPISNPFKQKLPLFSDDILNSKRNKLLFEQITQTNHSYTQHTPIPEEPLTQTNTQTHTQTQTQTQSPNTSPSSPKHTLHNTSTNSHQHHPYQQQQQQQVKQQAKHRGKDINLPNLITINPSLHGKLSPDTLNPNATHSIFTVPNGKRPVKQGHGFNPNLRTSSHAYSKSINVRSPRSPNSPNSPFKSNSPYNSQLAPNIPAFAGIDSRLRRKSIRDSLQNLPNSSLNKDISDSFFPAEKKGENSPSGGLVSLEKKKSTQIRGLNSRRPSVYGRRTSIYELLNTYQTPLQEELLIQDKIKQIEEDGLLSPEKKKKTQEKRKNVYQNMKKNKYSSLFQNQEDLGKLALLVKSSPKKKYKYEYDQGDLKYITKDFKMSEVVLDKFIQDCEQTYKIKNALNNSIS
jgi:hypothetical protein